MINENEKKYIYIAFALIALILIIVIVSIWMPMFKNQKEVSQITSAVPYTLEEYNSKTLDYYKKLTLEYINIDNYDKYKDILNQDFLDKYELNQDTLKEYLKNNKLIGHPTSSTIVYNSKIQTDGQKYIYTYNYKIGSEEKKIHFIEDYYNKYTISFDQESYPIVKNSGYSVQYEDLKFNFKVMNSYENTLVMNMAVENNSTEEYKFNLDSNSKASVFLNDNTSYNLDMVVVGSETATIKSVPNSTINTTLAFNIEIEEQANIKTIVLNDVIKSNGDKIIMSLDLN